MIRSCGWYLLITHKASKPHDMSCDVIFNMLNILLPSSSRWPFVVRFSKSIHQTDGHTISYHVICMPGSHDLTAQLEDPLTPIGQKAKWPQHFRLVFFNGFSVIQIEFPPEWQTRTFRIRDNRGYLGLGDIPVAIHPPSPFVNVIMALVSSGVFKLPPPFLIIKHVLLVSFSITSQTT